MTARAEQVQPQGTRVRLAYPRNPCTEIEIDDARQDHFGVWENPRQIWFSSYENARGFMRRVLREVKGVACAVVVP